MKEEKEKEVKFEGKKEGMIEERIGERTEGRGEGGKREKLKREGDKQTPKILHEITSRT
jgi:hypothetical protein